MLGDREPSRDDAQGRLARRPPLPTPIAPPIIVSQTARTALQAVARAHSPPPSLALRARLIFRAAALDRPPTRKIGAALGCSPLTVGQWRWRYLPLGVPGLPEALRSGRPRTIAAPTRVQVSALASAVPQEQDRTVTRWTLDAVV